MLIQLSKTNPIKPGKIFTSNMHNLKFPPSKLPFWYSFKLLRYSIYWRDARKPAEGTNASLATGKHFNASCLQSTHTSPQHMLIHYQISLFILPFLQQTVSFISISACNYLLHRAAHCAKSTSGLHWRNRKQKNKKRTNYILKKYYIFKNKSRGARNL